MICRMWHGWTAAADADAYDGYLKNELFPQVEHELGAVGYRGFHVLRLDRGAEIEFVTLTWFDSLEAVQHFAGANYEVPVISAKALGLLLRHAERVQHFELSASSWDDFQAR